MRSPLEVLYNFHWAVPGEAARMAQAHFGGLRGFLERHDLKAVINLRGPNPALGWWRREKRACEHAGAMHLDVMLDSRRLPTRAMLVSLMAAFEAAPRPFVLKCSGGQDRTSLAAALYILHRDGWTAMPAAERQFARWPYLHLPKKHQRWLKPFIRFAKEDAKGTAVAVWARHAYDPKRFSNWLEAQRMGDFTAGLFDKPRASRWQWRW